MALTNLWYYIIGYLEITIMGVAVERFINLALRENILIWDIKKYRGGMKAKVRARDFARLRSFLKNTGCRVKIVNKQGLPFLFHKMKTRKSLTLGLFITLVVLIYLSTFIWFVDIAGNERVSSGEIEQIIKDHGLQPGVRRTDVDPVNIENDLKAEYDEIMWAGVELTGTRALIKVVEKEPEPKIPQGPTNVVATRHAYIVDTMVFSGYPAVETGDTVRPGDILVHGRIVPADMERGEDDEWDLSEYPKTQAKGFVKGKIHYSGVGEIPVKDEVSSQTGEKYTRYGIYLEGETRFLDLKDIPFVEYDKRKTVRKLSLPVSDRQLGFITEQFYELETKSVKRDKERAQKIAQEKAIQEALAKARDDDEVANITDKFYRSVETDDDNMVSVQAIISVETDIGKEIEME